MGLIAIVGSRSCCLPWGPLHTDKKLHGDADTIEENDNQATAANNGDYLEVFRAFRLC